MHGVELLTVRMKTGHAETLINLFHFVTHLPARVKAAQNAIEAQDEIGAAESGINSFKRF